MHWSSNRLRRRTKTDSNHPINECLLQSGSSNCRNGGVGSDGESGSGEVRREELLFLSVGIHKGGWC